MLGTTEPCSFAVGSKNHVGHFSIFPSAVTAHLGVVSGYLTSLSIKAGGCRITFGTCIVATECLEPSVPLQFRLTAHPPTSSFSMLSAISCFPVYRFRGGEYPRLSTKIRKLPSSWNNAQNRPDLSYPYPVNIESPLFRPRATLLGERVKERTCMVQVSSLSQYVMMGFCLPCQPLFVSEVGRGALASVIGHEACLSARRKHPASLGLSGLDPASLEPGFGGLDDKTRPPLPTPPNKCHRSPATAREAPKSKYQLLRPQDAPPHVDPPQHPAPDKHHRPAAWTGEGTTITIKKRLSSSTSHPDTKRKHSTATRGNAATTSVAGSSIRTT